MHSPSCSPLFPPRQRRPLSSATACSWPSPCAMPRSDNLRVLALDVTDPQSIQEAVAAAGPIDVLVNNAGVGLMSVLEGTPMETIRDIFETNTFGTMAMSQAVLPPVSAGSGWCHRERLVQHNIEAATSACPLHREQGGRECIHRVSRAGTQAIRCARPPGAPGSISRDSFRQKRPAPYAEWYPRRVCWPHAGRDCPTRNTIRGHARGRRGGSGLASGDGSVLSVPDSSGR